MFDYDTNYIKLIDFGFAITYDVDDKSAEFYLPYYEYERIFDLNCALNVIMSMSNADMKQKIYSIEILTDIQEKQLKILELWKDTQQTNKHCLNLLNLINDLDKSYKSSTFD
ncbi:unnamed protein product [Rotaria sp. Silwood1]|nr:unnamed protein product [Rotaria sp. Silwood1]